MCLTPLLSHSAQISGWVDDKLAPLGVVSSRRLGRDRVLRNSACFLKAATLSSSLGTSRGLRGRNAPQLSAFQGTVNYFSIAGVFTFSARSYFFGIEVNLALWLHRYRHEIAVTNAADEPAARRTVSATMPPMALR
jgi:hypothetical protein